MIKFVPYFTAALVATQSLSFAQAGAPQSYQTSSSSINWTTDYQAALNRAAQENKPVLLFFTGSDWCTWCHKLEQEVLDTPTFSSLAGNKYVFVEVDFPKRSQIDPRTKQQNAQLQKKFNITGYPTIVLIDSKENVLGTTGYQQGGPQKYAEHLNQMTGKTSNSDDFQTLKAQYLQTKDASLIERGLNVDQNNFFAKEQYKNLIKAGKMYEPYTRALKERILENGSQDNHYFVAIRDYEDLLNQQENGQISSTEACAPLINYLGKHGSKDRDAWRVEATVAEHFYSTKHYNDALKWATNALEHAPQDAKPNVEKLISSIESDQKSQLVLESN